jgi:hypothetical protein
MTEPDSASPCPVCNDTVALDDRGGVRWHQHADTPQGSYHLVGCAGSNRTAESGILPTGTGDAAPRYSWIVRDSGDGDDRPWILLGYRWTSRKDAIGTAEHWLHHHEQVKTVEVVGDNWVVIA